MKKKLLIILILSIIATINAIYLTYSAYNLKYGISSGSFCDVSETFSCSNVFNYNFAWFGNIPFPLIALIVYPIFIILAVKGDYNSVKYIFILSVFGLVFNSYIIFNEYQINTYCLLCLACTIIITINLLLSVSLFKKNILYKV